MRYLFGAAAGLVLLVILLAAGGCSGAAPLQAPANVEQAAAKGVLAHQSWDEILAQARGTTVNWYLWGGSDVINTNIDHDIGIPLFEKYGVTLNRVPVASTADAVNKVLNEKAAGKDSGGSIDLIWINGENFRTLKEADLLYGPFTVTLPNSIYVNWSSPTVNRDFGVPVDGYESPWAAFQFVMEYNSAAVGARPPTTFSALKEWIEAHPGRFTYPAPPDHVGSAFVRQLFYWAAGGPEPLLEPFNQQMFDALAPKVWAWLNAIKPYLWRQGRTYPEAPAMADLLANGEIDFAMEYDASRASNFIAQGRYPPTIRTFVFDTGTVANISYVAIPYNAGNPAGALVVANYLLDPAFQLQMAQSSRWGWMLAVDPARLPAGLPAVTPATRGSATLPLSDLAAHALPEANADWARAIDEGWKANVLEK